MKLKPIAVFLMAACMAVATVAATGSGSCQGRDGTKCACSEGGKKGDDQGCGKSEGQGCQGKKEEQGKGSC